MHNIDVWMEKWKLQPVRRCCKGSNFEPEYAAKTAQIELIF